MKEEQVFVPIETQPYEPSEDKKAAIEKGYSDFAYCASLRQQVFEECDDMNLGDYWEESRKRSNNYTPEIEELEAAGVSNVFFGKTRNKRNQMAAFEAAQRPRAEIFIRNKSKTAKKTDKRLSLVMSNVYDWSMDTDNTDETYLDSTFT